DPEDVAATLAAVGVRYERRDIQGGLRPGAAAAEVRAECGELLRDVARELGLSAEEIISLPRGSEQTAELNARFANEQTLAAEHARLFLAGRGLISLQVGAEVFAVFGARRDPLAVTAGMAHWVSLGEEPHCLAVRLAPEGMAREETGEAIAGRFFGVEHYC